MSQFLEDMMMFQADSYQFIYRYTLRNLSSLVLGECVLTATKNLRSLLLRNRQFRPLICDPFMIRIQAMIKHNCA